MTFIGGGHGFVVVSIRNLDITGGSGFGFVSICNLHIFKLRWGGRVGMATNPYIFKIIFHSFMRPWWSRRHRWDAAEPTHLHNGLPIPKCRVDDVDGKSIINWLFRAWWRPRHRWGATVPTHPHIGIITINWLLRTWWRPRWTRCGFDRRTEPYTFHSGRMERLGRWCVVG